MEFAVLIAEFELRGFFIPELFFIGVEFIKGIDVSVAVIVRAFIDSREFCMLPSVKRISTVWAEIFRMRSISVSFFNLGEIVTDFASYLGFFLSVVEIEEMSRCTAVLTVDMFRNRGIPSSLNRFEFFIMLFFILIKELFIIKERSLLRWLRRGSERRERVDVELPVMRMFLFKIIFGFNIGIAIFYNFSKFFDNFDNIFPCKLGANPYNNPVYLVHKILPPFKSFGIKSREVVYLTRNFMILKKKRQTIGKNF